VADATGQKPAARTAPAAPASSLSEEQLRRLVAEQPTRGDAWQQLAVLALRQKRHAAAAECLDRALALDPGHADLHQLAAGARQALGHKEKAAEHLHRVVCLRPESAEAYNNWAIGLAHLRRFREAADAFAQAVRLRPNFPEAHNNWGNALAEQGENDAAIARFRSALELHPRYPEAHKNLGLTLARLGRLAEAAEELREARRLGPGRADVAVNLGEVLRETGDLEGALACFQDAAGLLPEQPEPLLQLALTLARLGRLDEAVGRLKDCLVLQGDAPQVYHHLGMLLARQEKLDLAAAALRNASRLRPDSPEHLNNLGNLLLRQRKLEEAADCFERAVALRPDHAPAHCNLGAVLLEQGRHEEAAERFREALRLRPDHAEARFNLGNALRKARRDDEALECFRLVLEAQPEHLGALLNTGIVHTERGELERAVELFTALIARKPELAEAHNCLGIARLHQQRQAEAVAQFDEGLRLKPDDAEIRLNRALCLLAMGDYRRGWEEYEWRWKLKRSAPRAHTQPPWDGSPMPEGTVLLWSEQGMGDILQFVRYAPLVKERVGTVLLDCPGPLRGLLASCPGVDALVGGGAAQPAPDAHAPLLSLPRLLGTDSLEKVPATVPYLFADAALRQAWRRRVPEGPGLRVGVVWQGNPQFSGDRFRSVPLERFRPLAQVPGVRLFSLQKGKGAEQLAELQEELGITDLGSQISGDFRDTAAAVLNLDLVVSVDSSVAHLTGALGVPVWILLPANPDWRWLTGRTDSLWYPTARLFRQRGWGDWPEVFSRVAEALRERAQRPRRQRVSVEVGLAELVERAAREGPPGSQGAGWDALREAGALEAPEVAELARRLRRADEALAEADRLVEALGDGGEAEAASLARRYAGARRDRAEALAAFSAWLAGSDFGSGRRQAE
jgi:tetratricopeptide (TPR) repeat protein